ncbi:MAG: tyrosine-protein phosphatase [Myxococcales bacterium]|nr:tyrosine-protein phosphatase [Myxococcota bacterium]MDW8284179.1 tyrosine-protein phosphatase [Myxococcales bacterium]
MRRPLLATLVLCWAACAARLSIPPPLPPLDGVDLARFDRVEEGVYRSAQPSAEQFRLLQRRYGVRSVLKLNGGHDHLPPGMQLIHHPMSATVEPSPEQLRRILDDLDRAPRPVLVHCTHGEDRTGLIVALYRIRHGASPHEAYQDMIRHRFHPYPGLWAAWRRATAGHRPQGPAPGHPVVTRSGG